MADGGMGSGGNSYLLTGQIAVTGSAQAIPNPNPGQLIPGGARVSITAGAADVYVGGPNVTTTTGHRVISNTSQYFLIKSGLYIVGTSGTATYLWEYN